MAEVEVVAEVDPNNDYHVVTDPESRPWAIDFPNPPNNPLNALCCVTLSKLLNLCEFYFTHL